MIAMERETPYRNIISEVRTPRFAVLIDKNDPYWQTYISGIVQSFSQAWGGEHFIIVPTDGLVIDDIFWKVLEAYSPDVIGRYIPSVADLERADPIAYEGLKEQHRVSWQFETEAEFEEVWNRQSKTGSIGRALEISSNLSKELKNRLSPFHFEDHIVSENVFYGTPLGYPFTKIEDIIESAKDRPTRVLAPMVVQDDSYRLLALSRAGELSDGYAETLRGKGFTIGTLPLESASFNLQEYLDAIESDEYEPSMRRAIAESLGGDDGEYPEDNFQSNLPFKLSMLHLGKYYKRDIHREDKESLTVVVGDTIDDYCLYYALSRLHDGVRWLPDVHLLSAKRKHMRNRRREDDAEIEHYDENEQIAASLVSSYFRAIGYAHGNKVVNITSISLTARQLSYRRRSMADIHYFGVEDFLSHSETIMPSALSLECVMQVIENNNHANQQDMIFQNGKSVGRVNTPKPKNFDPVNPADHRWITTLNIEGFKPPALSFIGEKIIQLHSTHDVRSAIDGLAYLCPNIGYFGGDIDVVTVRPSLALLSDNDMFVDYFANSGFTTELSDKGSYLKDTIDRYGSLEDVAAFFRIEANRNLFDQFLITKSENDGAVVYLSVERRAYLGFEAFKRKLSGEEEATLLIDELIARDIISRGFILQCSRCRLAAWYHVGRVGDEFTCSRCGLTQPYSHKNWKSPAEPRWYYRLAETVYLFYESSSHLTALALDKLRSEAPEAFHYISETTINNLAINNSKKEIDVLAISNGNIILGECKDCAVVARDVRKYLTIFSRLNIQPYQFLLVTTEESIDSSVQVELDKFKNHRLFTRKDLYDLTD